MSTPKLLLFFGSIVITFGSFAQTASAQQSSGMGAASRIMPDRICGYKVLQGFDAAPVTSNTQVKEILEGVMRAANVSAGAIQLLPANVGNAYACENEEGQGIFSRYILYNPEWLNQLIRETGSDWTARAMFAHEVGHHKKAHVLILRDQVSCAARLEAEADEVAGETLARLGATLEQAQVPFRTIGEDKGDECYPSRDERMAAVRRGWDKVKGTNSTADIENPKRVSEAELVKEGCYGKGKEDFLMQSWATQNSNFSAKTLDTLLICGSRDGYSQFVRALIDSGKNFSELAKGRAFYMASINGYAEVVNLFLDHGIKPNVRDERGNTPLFGAASGNHQTIIDRLLRAGIDVNAVNEKGRNALLYSLELAGAGSINPMSVAKLVEAGIDVNQRGWQGQTSLHIAVEWDKIGIVRELLKAENIEVNAKDDQGRTAFDKAILNRAMRDLLQSAGGQRSSRN